MGSAWQEQRMNQVGVWTCRAAGDTSYEHRPINEWIGFSVCIDLPEPGLYIVGSGGDNLIRMSIDGDSVYQSPSSNVAQFNYWWLRTRSLSSGTHTIEMEGQNVGGPGGFGAEIYGPFPQDTPLDDATLQALDFAGNIAWSSVDVIGGEFILGEGGSGLSCEDGSAVDVCEVDPVCIEEVNEECL
ncbi:MAG: hypothetical protein ACJAZO_001253 [Myxococcota bacterium]|jgi:hypothetical protein